MKHTHRRLSLFHQSIESFLVILTFIARCIAACRERKKVRIRHHTERDRVYLLLLLNQIGNQCKSDLCRLKRNKQKNDKEKENYKRWCRLVGHTRAVSFYQLKVEIIAFSLIPRCCCHRGEGLRSVPDEQISSHQFIQRIKFNLSVVVGSLLLWTQLSTVWRTSGARRLILCCCGCRKAETSTSTCTCWRVCVNFQTKIGLVVRSDATMIMDVRAW